VDLAPHWLLQISFHRLEDETDKLGLVCRTYSPRIGCAQEETHTEAALSGLRAGLVRMHNLSERLRVGGGAGLSFNHVDAGARALTGMRADLLVPNGGQIGAFGTLSAAVRPVLALPARVLARFNAHWVDFNACSGEDPPQYAPFCSSGTFWEMEMGVSYAF
jgi:hypothetical protein